MPTFKFDKPISDIEDPVLIPVDWHPVEVTEDPTVGPNGKLREALEANGINLDDATEAQVNEILNETEGAGFTMTIRLGVISPDPRFSGRSLTCWLSWPSTKDEGLFTKNGQKKSDWKMTQIVNFAKAGGTKPKSTNVNIEAGMTLQVYINQRKAWNSEEFENFVDNMAGFKTYK